MHTPSIGFIVQSYFPPERRTAIAVALGTLVSRYCLNTSWPVAVLGGCAFQVISRLAGDCLRSASKREVEFDPDDDIFDKISQGPSAPSSAPGSAPGSSKPSPELLPAEAAAASFPPPLVLDREGLSPVRALTSPTNSESSGSDYEGPTSLYMNRRELIRNGLPVELLSPAPLTELPEARFDSRHPIDFRSHNGDWAKMLKPAALRATTRPVATYV